MVSCDGPVGRLGTYKEKGKLIEVVAITLLVMSFWLLAPRRPRRAKRD
jgi:hypothetical protein